MRLTLSRLGVFTLALLLVTAASQVAEAQREGGRRGRGGRGFPMSAARLATAAEVQTALKLSDEQKEKVEAISDELRDKAREVFQGGGGFGELQKLNQEASSKLADVLDDQQEKRLLGVLIQVNGPGAVYEPAVAKELGVTPEQQTKLDDVREANLRTMGETFRELRDQNLSRDEIRAKLQELRAAADKKILAELSPEQQQKLESLKGEPVEIDMTQFRGFGAREGRARRGDRDADQPANENAAGDSGT